MVGGFFRGAPQVVNLDVECTPSATTSSQTGLSAMRVQTTSSSTQCMSVPSRSQRAGTLKSGPPRMLGLLHLGRTSMKALVDPAAEAEEEAAAKESRAGPSLLAASPLLWRTSHPAAAAMKAK